MDRKFIFLIFVLLFISLGIFLFIPKESATVEFKKEKVAVPNKVIAVYMTAWSASDSNMVDYVIGLSKRTGVNAVVIDIKDWSGRVPYNTDVADFEKYGAERVIIKDMGGLVEKLHNEGLYVIGRMTVFQDPVLASQREDLAVKSRSGGLWQDFNGLSWISPDKKEAWDYNVALAKDALNKGFDEINFDYIRFPSDGDLKDMDLNIPSEREVIKIFSNI